jgi:5-hydroxytryptamine receptor 2
MNANGSFSENIDDSGLIISVRQRNSNQLLIISYRWPALFLLFFSIIGIIGNLLVCLAIGTERRLHNRTNWFLFSLALADMIVSGVVIPLAIVKEFTGKNKNKKNKNLL